ncbi:polysaccharide deacetylase family protein [Paenibacillus tengchongensis]|uniref:polysaccharide deacetylase family protein n=1 Tax=Paenibacillus tengchongensis TaxID=2608684 RepID=UPI00124C7BDA|nr:polysaccharide deacetylase family protein [Paenibacillus tengchongensis]
MGKVATLLLLSAVMLTACSGNNNDTAAQEEAPPASAVVQSATPAPSPDSSDTASPSASPAGSEAPAAEVTPAAEDGTAAGTPSAGASAVPAPDTAAIPVLYQMNKNYDIVPIEDGTEKKVVLLTFDDGPKDAAMINSLFDTLDKHQAKAIFFVNGYRVKENPDLLKLIQSRGGIIGNHSWDHIILKNEPYEKVKQQIEDVQAIVKEVTGETPAFFRPPHGAGGDVGKKVAAENQLLYMNWSVGSLDYEMKESESGKTEKLISNVTSQLHSGSNILMHELPWTVEALDQMLTTLEGKGYSFVDPRSIQVPAP